MHAKSVQVTEFLQNDLLAEIHAAFGQADAERISQAQAKVNETIEQARNFGAPNPDETPAVKTARAELKAAQDSGNIEAEIYEHLYRFFERYYDAGDFMSRRYYGRETEHKAAPYAVPYDGREVYLHWANKDQYYIKSSEYLSNFTFDIHEALAKLNQNNAQDHNQTLDLIAPADATEDTTADNAPHKVHFQIASADEGEHGNVKTSDDKKREFTLHSHPIAFNEQGELVVQFEYKVLPKGQPITEADETHIKTQYGTLNKGDLPLYWMADSVLTALKNHEHPHAKPYHSQLSTPAPTDKQTRRPLLAKYISHYTARNSMDYFIHKDLGGFLKRELDFFIKNELMRLDDIGLDDAHSNPNALTQTLSKIRVLRRIATQLITFLAQLENFQKKLWLKKKFVTETQYCITLDRIIAMGEDANDLLQAIANNDAQRAEWVKLYAINEIQGKQDLAGKIPAYSEPLTVDFLRANPYLVVDTALFEKSTVIKKTVIPHSMRNLPEQNKSTVIAGLTRNPPARSENEEIAAQGRNDTNIFKEQLLALIPDLDAQCDGVLIHSENFQALGLMQEKYREHVKCVYIDPPYNTDSNSILYKNSYKHSSWLSLINDRLLLSENISQNLNGLHIIAIDDAENSKLQTLIHQLSGDEKTVTPISVIHNPGGTMGKNFSSNGEYAIFVHSDSKRTVAMENRSDSPDIRDLMNTAKGASANYLRSSGKTCFYPVYVKDSEIIGFGEVCADDFHPNKNIIRTDGVIEVYPIDADNIERKWVLARETVEDFSHQLKVKIDRKSNFIRIERTKDELNYKTIWLDSKYSAKKYGTEILGDVIPITRKMPPLYPKSLFLVRDCIHAGLNYLTSAFVLDYFGGSGTTAHAVINLNREDNGSRKYILVEQNAYFDTVLKPRIQKVVYSKDWKDGKPKPDDKDSLNGISHCFKTIRLESYEDTLNNLVLRTDVDRDNALTLNADLRRDYLLNYALDVETQGSNSLLNIAQFTYPFAYQMRIKRPNSDDQAVQSIDLIETFNWLIGLWVTHSAARVQLSAAFSRERDPDLPNDQATRLVATLSKAKENDAQTYTFKLIEGYTLARAGDNDSKIKTLIVWRTLSDDGEQDNAVLQAYLVDKLKIRPRESMYEVIYVNGSHTLPNPVIDDANIKVRLIEEAFMNAMWQVQDV